jgi:hypothetical protein
VAEVLVQFTDPITSPSGEMYIARACGSEMPDGLWQGWVEFLPAGDGAPLRSGRETTQPNRNDVEYWATGLTYVYLEGALERARSPLRAAAPPDVPPPLFDGPAPDIVGPPAAESVLNPFSVYRKGETLLRRQLGALSGWHLVNIIRAYELSGASVATLEALDEVALIELIVTAVRERAPASAR